MKELDILLERFVTRGLAAFPEDRLPDLEELLATPDVDLLRLLTEESAATGDPVLEALRGHTRTLR